MRLGWLPAVAGLLMLAAPAAAASRFNVYLQGELVGPSGPGMPVSGFPLSTGATLQASWDIDLNNAVRSPLPLLGGVGGNAVFAGAVSNGIISIADSAAIVLLFQRADSEGNIFAIDNGNNSPTNPNVRLDQLAIADGQRFADGMLLPAYDIVPVLGSFGPDIYLSSVVFGRSQTFSDGSSPMLLDTVETIDPFSVWADTGAPYTVGLTFRQGTPTTLAEASQLPISRYSLRNVFVQLTPFSAVPEPGSWAMLIAGFGLVGAAARRRRAGAAAA